MASDNGLLPKKNPIDRAKLVFPVLQFISDTKNVCMIDLEFYKLQNAEIIRLDLKIYFIGEPNDQ